MRIDYGVFDDPAVSYQVTGTAGSDEVNVVWRSQDRDVTVLRVDTGTGRVDAWHPLYLTRSETWRQAMVERALAVYRSATRQCEG
ncbi:hypothetical protein LX16_0229 [Stackebrandtia albiflava]|uniref:Uncharacterized protein n=1 Tax=Stackebrandtia albiflava TaxID=406432 RepID=A0A562V9I8_9ACTN|nr:hypothetical protein [Stackebrandtia albiflava]TWJ14544.1 hypothetical protein LX16_0229 [Stackebrandtia albiflava]